MCPKARLSKVYIYLKLAGFASGVNELGGNKNMKRNKGMQLGAVLAVMLLMSMALVPAVSAEKKSKEKPDDLSISPELYKKPYINPDDIVYSTPLNESELISFVFSETWLLENDKSKDTRIIETTFPTSQLINMQTNTEGYVGYMAPSVIRNDEKVFLFQMPKTMFKFLNSDPNNVTINFPVEHFVSYTNVSELHKNKSKKEVSKNMNTKEKSNIPKIEDNEISSLLLNNYEEHEMYARTITGLTFVAGNIKPYSFSMNPPLMGWFSVIYQENEIYFNGQNDAVEITLQYNNDGRIMLTNPIYYGDIENPHWDKDSIWINANSMHSYDYYVFVDGANSEYEIDIYDTVDKIWYHDRYIDSTPSTYIDVVAGSSELYISGVPDPLFPFEAITYPITDEWLSDGNSWYKPDDVLSKYMDTKDTYVEVNGNFKSNGNLVFKSVTGSAQS